MSVMVSAPARRYSVLVTPGGDDVGTWHTITASSIGDALRGVRNGLLWQNTQAIHAPEEITVSAIECLGFSGR